MTERNDLFEKTVYRIETDRLVLRCWNPDDAPAVMKAVEESREHLKPWMPWAKEPTSLPKQVEVLRQFRGEFDLGKDFVYGVLDLDETQVLGGCGLHTRLGPGALEIGYWIHVDHINKGLATEVAGALTRVAFEIYGVNRIEIHHDPENIRSGAVPRKLGYRYEGILSERILTPEGRWRDSAIWTMFAGIYPESAAAVIPIRAYDGSGDLVFPRTDPD